MKIKINPMIKKPMLNWVFVFLSIDTLPLLNISNPSEKSFVVMNECREDENS